MNFSISPKNLGIKITEIPPGALFESKGIIYLKVNDTYISDGGTISPGCYAVVLHNPIQDTYIVDVFNSKVTLEDVKILGTLKFNP